MNRNFDATKDQDLHKDATYLAQTPEPGSRKPNQRQSFNLAQVRLQNLFHLNENYSPPLPPEVLQNTSRGSHSALTPKFI